MPKATLVSTEELRSCLELWYAMAEHYRDRHENNLIHGHLITAAAIDLAAEGVESCIDNLEELIAAAEGTETFVRDPLNHPS